VYLCGDQVVEGIGVGQVSPKDHPLTAATLGRPADPEQSEAGGVGSLVTIETQDRAIHYRQRCTETKTYRKRERDREREREIEMWR
jgi:hypothetical protein